MHANTFGIYITRHVIRPFVLPIPWGLLFGSIKKPPEILSGGYDFLHPPLDSITLQHTYLRDTETGAYRIPYRIHQEHGPSPRHFYVRLHFLPLPSRDSIRKEFFPFSR